MFDNVEAIATEFRSRLKAIQPKGPYLLAGGCEGGMVAFEMALQFQQEGEEVALLGQLDTPVRGFFQSKPAFLSRVRTAKLWVQFCIRRMLTSNPAEYERHLSIWIGIWHTMYAYHPGRRFDGDVHLFRAARTLGMADVALGWDDRVTGRVVIHKVPGRHKTWMEYPGSAAIFRGVLDAISPPFQQS
jgi:thioesterase domain-containing protein